MVKILITTIRVNLVPLGRHLRFHIFFHHSLSEGHTLFLQLGCFGLDFTSFCICIPQSRPMASFRAFNLSFFSLPQEEEKMKQGDFFVAELSTR